jgi:ribosomal protein S1
VRKKEKSDLPHLRKTVGSEATDENTSKKITSKKEPQTMDELLAMNVPFKIGVKKGDMLEGRIVSISPKEILIDIGKKSYGIVAEWELEQVKEYAATLKAGDKVVAQVVSPENDMGYIILSLRHANLTKRWQLLAEAKEKGTDIEVTGIEEAKGGLLIDWQGLRGFIPSTQLDGNVATNLGNLISRKLKVKVLEVDKSLNRLIVSQKASVLGVTPTFQKERLEKIKLDDVLKGTVSGIAPFGIFVDIDGLEGLVHISEIAWEKVDTPASLYKIGDKVEVLVLGVNKDVGKLNLSIKRLTPDPWKNILDRYPLESVITGKIVRAAPYGVFIQLEPGIEGLLHVSKIIPGEEPKVGEMLECMVENIDPVKRKMSLTVVPKEKPVGYR